MAQFKELTFEEIREELKGTAYDRDDWVLEYHRNGMSRGLTVKEWIAERDKMEAEYLELVKKPGFRDPGTVLLNIDDETGDVYHKT